jgi:hypothetical protein
MITIYLPQISHHNHAECIRLGLYIKSRNVYSLLVKLDFAHTSQGLALLWSTGRTEKLSSSNEKKE